MPDWTKSMQQTYEYVIVDPATWKDKELLTTVTSSSISWDATSDTLCSASISITGELDECYIRIYLVTIQNGVKERFPLATVLVQTPSWSYDGKVQTITLDAYSPLTELKENSPAYGYTRLKNADILYDVSHIAAENMRAPVVTEDSENDDNRKLFADFTADGSDTWLSFLQDLISQANYEFGLEADGTVVLSPVINMAEMQSKFTFDDGNSSILYPTISVDRDLYGIPNVVEVVYSSDNQFFQARVENKDENSPISTVNRGRVILHRETNPSFSGIPTQAMVNEYAKTLLKSLSSLEYTVTYKHGYYPVYIGDCVTLNYERAGIINTRAKITQQNITCEPGCPVEETATFTKQLWG